MGKANLFLSPDEITSKNILKSPLILQKPNGTMPQVTGARMPSRSLKVGILQKASVARRAKSSDCNDMQINLP